MMVRFVATLALPLALSLAAGALVSCASHESATHQAVRGVAPVDPPKLTDDKPRDYPGLHNVVAYHDGFYSGSVPEGDAGFDVVAGMGVMTIISVDGATPEVEYATVRGLRYIHLPIGYNGFDDARKLEIARATRDAMAKGPVYVHCHHGKHRSAGAAAAAAVSLGWMTPDEATARMKVSGTAPNYKGLYACAAASTAVGADVLDRVPANFPQAAPPKGFIKSMVELDEINEHLKLIEKAGWQSPKDHPDLVPAAEAGRMADILRVLSTGDRAASKPAGFAAGLKGNGDAAQKLEDLLAAGERDAARFSAQLKIVAASCKDCHAQFRD
ncbi:MAG: cytochrome c [Phycisphaerales bacterium]|nr:cytochrome c [Phycisphaerales bacterium]